MSRSTKRFVFLGFIYSFILFLHKCMFPACCFRQITYMAQGRVNGVLYEMWTHLRFHFIYIHKYIYTKIMRVRIYIYIYIYIYLCIWAFIFSYNTLFTWANVYLNLWLLGIMFLAKITEVVCRHINLEKCLLTRNKQVTSIHDISTLLDQLKCLSSCWHITVLTDYKSIFICSDDIVVRILYYFFIHTWQLLTMHT